jgi:hypothetical protein
MSENVVKLRLVDYSGTKYDADTVLEGAKGTDFEALAIIGQTTDGEMYVAGNCNLGELFILWEKAKNHLLLEGDE